MLKLLDNTERERERARDAIVTAANLERVHRAGREREREQLGTMRKQLKNAS